MWIFIIGIGCMLMHYVIGQNHFHCKEDFDSIMVHTYHLIISILNTLPLHRISFTAVLGINIYILFHYICPHISQYYNQNIVVLFIYTKLIPCFFCLIFKNSILYFQLKSTSCWEVILKIIKIA